MKKSVARAQMVATTAATVALAPLLGPTAAFAAGDSTSCRNTDGRCELTIYHPSKGTMSIDVSSTNVAGVSSVPFEIAGPGGYLCPGRVPDDGVVHSYVCTNVPKGSVRGAIAVGGGSYLEVGLRY